jgi:hypothetical protein
MTHEATDARDPLARAEELLARLEATRAELERLAEAEDADRAIDILGELAQLSKQVEEELQRARREAEREGEGEPDAPA